MDNSQEAEIKHRIIARCEARYGKPLFNLFPIRQVITVKPIVEPFKVKAIEIDRQLAFARADRDLILESGMASYVRYHSGRPYTVYTPAFVTACNRVIALEKQAEELARPFGFEQHREARDALYLETFSLSEKKK